MGATTADCPSTSSPYYFLDITRGGSAGNPITIKAQHKWGAVLDGADLCWSVVNIDNGANNLVIQDLEIANGNYHGIKSNTSGGGSSVSMVGNHIHAIGQNYNAAGDSPTPGGAVIFANVGTMTVDGNLIHDIGPTSTNGCRCYPSCNSLVHTTGISS